MERSHRLVLTNNPRMASEARQVSGYEVLMYPVTCEELLLKCTELIQEGFRFAADPLGGYHFRPNPYHTMFLKKEPGADKEKRKHGRESVDSDLLLIGSMQDLCRKHKKFIERYRVEAYEEDYQIMDSSVAQRSLMRLNEIIY